MKRSFIQLIRILEEYDLIEDNSKIISNGSLHDRQELTTSNIPEGFVVYQLFCFFKITLPTGCLMSKCVYGAGPSTLKSRSTDLQIGCSIRWALSTRPSISA
jgi:hypothetical protein